MLYEAHHCLPKHTLRNAIQISIPKERGSEGGRTILVPAPCSLADLTNLLALLLRLPVLPNTRKDVENIIKLKKADRQ